jgi:RNA polymerase sigma factor (sigma-70 family)
MIRQFTPNPWEERILSDASSDYERLIRPIEEQMLGSIWRVLRNGADADDALQEAFVTIWKRLDRICCHPNPHALILRICADAACQVLRRSLRRQRREDSGRALQMVAYGNPSPADQLGEQERHMAIMRAMARLSRHQSVAIVMRLVQQQSYAEIAAALGCREVTARKHVARARQRLRSLLAHLAPPSFRET